MTFEQASAIPQACVMALQAFRDKRQMKEGDKVLMNGGGGAVGSFAIQLAKLFDLEITAVDSGFKQDFMRSIGADYVIDTSGLQDRLIKTIGSSKNSEQIKAYLLQAKEFINQYRHQKDLDFDYQDDHDFLQALKSGLKKIQMIGQELILGKIFDEMGFGFNQVN